MLRHRVDLSDVAARTRSTLVMLMWLFYAFYLGGGGNLSSGIGSICVMLVYEPEVDR